MDSQKIQKIVTGVMKQDPDKVYIKSISLFGSFLRGKASEESDVDLVFEMRKNISLFRVYRIQQRLEKKLGRKVDLISKDSLDKYIRKDILTEAKKIYENQ